MFKLRACEISLTIKVIKFSTVSITQIPHWIVKPGVTNTMEVTSMLIPSCDVVLWNSGRKQSIRTDLPTQVYLINTVTKYNKVKQIFAIKISVPFPIIKRNA